LFSFSFSPFMPYRFLRRRRCIAAAACFLCYCVLCVCSFDFCFASSLSFGGVSAVAKRAEAFAARDSLFLLQGVIQNAEGEAIAGASARVVGSNQGAYSDARGRFRLSLPVRSARVRVSSLGYETREIVVDADSTTTVALQPLPIRLQAVEALDISAESIIRNAVARKYDNLRGVNAISRRLYTKFSTELTTKVLLAKPRTEAVIAETISLVQEQFKPKRVTHTTTLQRRQTANFPQQANVFSFVEVFNFLNDELIINSTRMRSPLASNALDFYDYELIDRKPYSLRSLGGGESGVVHILRFKPKSRAFPAFEGTLSILDDSFALVEADFATTKNSSLGVGLENARYNQRFEYFRDSAGRGGAWVPSYLRLQGKIGVELGVANVGGEISIESIASNVTVGSDLPPEVLNPSATTTLQKIQRKKRTVNTAKIADDNFITIAPAADSLNEEFWKTATLLEYTPKEDSAYRAIDSVTKVLAASGRRTTADIVDSTLEAVGDLLSAPSALPQFTERAAFPFALFGGAARLGLSPVLMRPRVEGQMYGLEAAIDWRQSSAELSVAASETWNWFGSLRLAQRFLLGEDVGFAVTGEAFSRLRSIQPARLQSFGWAGYATDYGIFEGHYDYYRDEGARVGVQAAFSSLEASVSASLSRQTSLVSRGAARFNLPVQNGEFLGVRGEISWNAAALNPIAGLPTTGAPLFSARLSGLLGEELSAGERFGKIEASATLIQPTFFTGYAPMYLAFIGYAGVADERTPPQERFVLFRRYTFAGSPADLLTPAIGAFGGTQMATLRVEHNFSDLLWRAVGLPTHKGRGLEFILHGGAAMVGQLSRWSPGGEGFPKPTGGWYSELGFGVGRIPLFVIDFVALRFDGAWSVGGTNPRHFGWSVSVQFGL
jgi:hypothetical protein